MVDTYNAKYESGDIAHGGYATAIRAHERFVFALPEKLEYENAASMACAGLTVFSPLTRFGVKAGSKVGIIGIGGLGLVSRLPHYFDSVLEFSLVLD